MAAAASKADVYVCDSEDMANQFQALAARETLPWLDPSLHDIRACRIQRWSDLTRQIKQG